MLIFIQYPFRINIPNFYLYIKLSVITDEDYIIEIKCASNIYNLRYNFYSCLNSVSLANNPVHVD